MPKISVLMPAYNVEKYIAEAIESILCQTFTDFEFIIINDGSTDNTADIVRKYDDPRIRFIDNKQNQGLISVLNQGLDLCQGEYIARMDSDDIALPERFAKQVKYLDEHPDVVVVGAWTQLFGKLHDVCKYLPNIKLMDLVIHGNQVAHPAAMLRTSVLRTNNIYYNSAYTHVEDYDLWTILLGYGEIHNIQEILLNYRWHDANISSVYHNLQQKNADLVRTKILNSIFSNKVSVKTIMDMTRELNQCLWLFGFIPLIRRKQYSVAKTKYYLFWKLPLVRIQDGKIYLFEYIKIGKYK